MILTGFCMLGRRTSEIAALTSSGCGRCGMAGGRLAIRRAARRVGWRGSDIDGGFGLGVSGVLAELLAVVAVLGAVGGSTPGSVTGFELACVMPDGSGDRMSRSMVTTR